MKNIYIKQDEEIISVIDKLIQSDLEDINLVVPSGAQIWQSSINLKLLKREADNLGRQVTLVVSNDLGAEMAERIGFIVKKEKELPVEFIQPEKDIFQEEDIVEDSDSLSEEKQDSEDDGDMIGLLVEELKSGQKPDKDFSFFQKKDKKEDVVLSSFSPKKNIEQNKKMFDIVNPVKNITKASPSRVKSLREKIFFKKKSIPKESVSESQNIIEHKVSVGSKWSKLLVGFVIITFILAGLVAYLVLPNTEIVLTPKKEKVSFDLSVVGSKDISQVNEELNKIPLQEIEVSKTKSKEFSATAEKQLNEKARGFVTIYNEYSSSPQTLVATTRFESSDGKTFRIFESVTVPGAEIVETKIVPSSVEVEIIADQPGSDYNIGPTDFTIPGFKGTPKFVGFYGRSKAAMAGGSTDKVKVISVEDIKKAEESLSEEVRKEVRQSFDEQVPSDLKIIEDSLKEELITISTIKEGEATERFTVEMKAVVSALLLNEGDLKKLVDVNIASKVSGDRILLTETQQIKWIDSKIDESSNVVSFSLYAEEEVAWKIDIQSLKSNLAGQSELEVRKYLSNQPEIGEAKVSFWPFWVKKIPSQEKKIKIIVIQ